MEATAAFFREVHAIVEKLGHLSDNAIPDKWRELDKIRLRTSCSISLELLSKRMSLDIVMPTERPQAEFLTYLLEQDHLQTSAERCLQRVLDELRAAKAEIETLRATEETNAAKRRADEGGNANPEHAANPAHVQKSVTTEVVRLHRSQAGHRIALNALDEAIERAVRAYDAAGRREWSVLGSEFSEAARNIRTVLDPARSYLSSVIDRQLASSEASSRQQWDLPELVFATLGQLLLERPATLDERTAHALERIIDHVGADGSLPVGAPYHSSESGAGHLPANSTILIAIAHLVRHSRFPLTYRMASRLLPNLKERCFGHEASDRGLDGWFGEYDRTRSRTSLYETAIAVEALSSITRMLDEGINQIILEHFNVRDVSEKPPLDHLFYPDYGLSSEDVKEQAKKVHRESIALTLQKLRAHVSRCPDRPKLHSLVLHGPPGTGKTTLVEALARTCAAQLVEVTPSDLAKGGEVAIEQRARAVFYALSLLSRVVILFDEFDPVLKSRDSAGDKTLNIFSFLTPGMLPKLKELNDRAKELGTCYVLITNHIGTLDDAAVRSGRFDLRVGIYPPDPLSRLGYFAMLCGRQLRRIGEKGSDRWVGATPQNQRLAEFVVRTAGMGMTPLMQKGWFRWVRSYDLETPMACVFGLATRSLKEFSFEHEAQFEERVKGTGPSASNEYFQWGWLTTWDRDLPDPDKESFCEDEWRKVGTVAVDWPSSEHAIECVTRMESGLRSGDSRLVIGLLGDEFLLRWKLPKEGLYETILSQLDSSRTAEEIRRACAEPMLSVEDLHVFEHCAEESLRNPLFQDESVSSQVVYVSVLVKDFVRQQQALTRIPQTPGSDDRLVSGWEALRYQIQRIDDAISTLFVHLYTQYRAYLESSAFWQQDADAERSTRIIKSAMERRTKHLK